MHSNEASGEPGGRLGLSRWYFLFMPHGHDCGPDGVEEKKTGGFFGIAFFPLFLCVSLTTLMLQFIVDNGCMPGGVAWRWHALSNSMAAGKLKRTGKDTDGAPAPNYSWPDAGYPNTDENPKCYWAIEIMNAYFPLAPLCFCIICALAIYLPEKKYVEMVKFTLPFGVYMGVFCTYGILGPRLYIDENTTDDDRVILRVVAHPALMEAAAVPFRSIGKNLTSVSLRIAYLFFPCKTTTLYSRFLVNAVSDQTLLIISSVALGGVEILMRTTVHQRDKLSQVVVAKLTGRKFTSFDRAFLMEYKCSLVVVEMVFELADIFAMAGLFSFMCQPGGPLREGLTIDSGNPFMRQAGFHIEDYIIDNAIIQVLIEVAVSMCCLILEISLGFPVLQVVRKGYFLPFFVSSTCFGFLYSIWFMNGIFQWPLLDFYAAAEYKGEKYILSEPYSETHLAQLYYDLYWTWIYYVPVNVERQYQLQWTEETYG